jgi:large subunit ribosomal protein L23
MHIFEVLRKPVITEKSTILQESGKYVFEIATKSNKAQVREAVERAFEVKVLAVNVVNTPGEVRRVGGGRPFRSPTVKKAIVTLRTGDSIQLFEGA